MTLHPVNLYGSLAIIREKKGLMNWVCLGQIIECGGQPVILGVSLEKKFTENLDEVLGESSAKKYTGRHVCLDLRDLSSDLPTVVDGQGGSALLLHIEGTLEGMKSNNTWLRGCVKYYEGVAKGTVKVKSESGTFTTLDYFGKARLDGPDYMKKALPSLLVTGYDWKGEEAHEYERGKPFPPMKFQLVVKEQYLSFV